MSLESGASDVVFVQSSVPQPSIDYILSITSFDHTNRDNDQWLKGRKRRFLFQFTSRMFRNYSVRIDIFTGKTKEPAQAS
jgi:hypothetical protein